MNKFKNAFVAIILIIEWFEFSFYLYLGYIFSQIFFPKDDQNGLLIIYLIFFISYLSRPVGALIFGALSDMLGRKKPLVISAFLVGISTMFIGFIPSYNNIGWWAPIILLILRMLQSLSVSGEFNNSALYLIENAKFGKKLSYGSITGFGSSLGMFLGGISALLIMTYDTQHQAWRYVYIALGLVGIITCYLRRKLSESSEYKIFQNSNKFDVSFIQTVKSQYGNIIRICIIAGFMAMYIYVLNIFFSNYMVLRGWYSQDFSLFMIIIAQGFTTLLIPIYAKLVSEHNYQKYLFVAISAIGITGVLFFNYADNLFILIVGVSLYALANGYISTVVFYYMYSLLKIEFRCSITSLAWAIPATIIGGSSLPIAQVLAKHHYENVIVFIVILFSAISWLSIKRFNK
ncbi:MFS transporter [Francisellaceae bacterium]|nr:MFS transporter [Francisellaceae bacterium]